ncbi:protein transport protein SEC31 isoform X1 [Helianthus annuus]|uniref:DUF7036 domain-containing protein n=1 Tax=Helianthus annuus TaxID=4232 RepID=A0A251UI06_HELAN|nr:protein transport protein SEC31 isoform X1 [Helianthus annuus]
MGKLEEQPVPADVTQPQPPVRVADTCSCCCVRVSRLFRFRCVFVLILGVSVLLSAVFWLPPFFSDRDHEDLDLDSHFKGHDIVATFMVQKPLSLLQDDLPQLGGDIFDELRVPTTKVVIIKAETTDSPNATKVIFGVDPDEHNSKISSYAKSLVRDSFVSLVLQQSPLRLTESLFGEPSSFEVLKFVGGITVTPDQSAYPLQKVQIRFNFTLNFSIQQILDHFVELTSQLKSGLHLGPYENLHVSLTNAKGSTIAHQTTVQSSVVLAIGTPSTARSKQLAQTIKGSPTKNLGLNNTQFGRVKQISLSSYFNGSSGGGRAPAPSPAPLPHPPQQPNRNHHHHHHHDKQLPPAKPPSIAPPPVPAPAPHKFHAKPPDCHSGYNRKKRNTNKHPPLYPPVSQPALPPHTPPPPLRRTAPRPPRSPPPPPRLLPPPPPPPLSPPPPSYRPPPPPLKLPPPSPPPPSLKLPPASPPPPRLIPPPPPPVPDMIPASSPLPNVVFAHTHPPSKSESDADPPDTTPSGSFLQPSSAAGAACAGVSLRAIPTFVAVMILKNIIPFN